MNRYTILLLTAIVNLACLNARAEEAGRLPAVAVDAMPTWIVNADAVWLQRVGGNGAILGSTTFVTPGGADAMLASQDAEFEMQAGMRFRLCIETDSCTAWEGVYLGMQTWNGGNAITPDLANAGTLATSPFTQTDKLIGGFDQSLSFHTTSTLNNVEINRRRLLAANEGASLQWLAGLRYLQWNESLALVGVNSLPPTVEEIDVACENQLVGPQLGAELRRNWDHWYLSVQGKTGLLANVFREHRSNGNSTGVQPGGFPVIDPIDGSRSGACVSAVIDVSVLADYQVTRHLSARGGYQLLYVSGLAQAPAQLGGFDNSGNVFLHGPTAGLEYRW